MTAPPQPAGRIANHLANERTFLAYLRTALSVMAFGFVIARFNIFERIVAMQDRSITVPVTGAAERLGIAFAAFGCALAAIGMGRYFSDRRAIESDVYRPNGLVIGFTGAATFVLGIVVVAALVHAL
jgi:putative membrane protein